MIPDWQAPDTLDGRQRYTDHHYEEMLKLESEFMKLCGMGL